MRKNKPTGASGLKQGLRERFWVALTRSEEQSFPVGYPRMDEFLILLKKTLRKIAFLQHRKYTWRFFYMKRFFTFDTHIRRTFDKFYCGCTWLHFLFIANLHYKKTKFPWAALRLQYLIFHVGNGADQAYREPPVRLSCPVEIDIFRRFCPEKFAKLDVLISVT